MLDQQRVLVVDELSDTQEVLQTILEPRGLQVDSPTSNNTHPDVIVIDLESAAAKQPANHHWNKIPQVIIGSAQLPPKTQQQNRYLTKPFHYPELIQAIEQLLATSEQ